MNNLESLKSQLLYEYSEEEFNLWRSQNFYQHHNLPKRTFVKTSEGVNNNARKTMIQISTKNKQKKSSQLMTQTIGRNLFDNSQKTYIPGPGTYDTPLQRHSSHCYIKKEEEFVEGKIAKRLRKRKLINECRGPGIYNPQTAFNLTSKSKTASQGTFSRSSINRLIMPKNHIENLYLASSNSQQYLRGFSHPGPLRHRKSTYQSSNSKFPRPLGFTMSTTQRSSLVNDNGLPGPGFYNWSKIFERKANGENKQKGKIQYKFVYGHPS